MTNWKRGLPPEGELDGYEIHRTPGGFIWHRKRVEPTQQAEAKP